MENVNQSIEALKRLDDSPDLVDIMISIEDYLDRNDIYAFKNWILGELVDGPIVMPYWIKVTFKWDYKKMPDPGGALRLLPHGTQVEYTLDYEEVPQPIKSPSDYQPGTHKPKIKKEKVWVVDMMIPRKFIEDIDSEIIDLYDDRVDDMETVEDAEAEGKTESDEAELDAGLPT